MPNKISEQERLKKLNELENQYSKDNAIPQSKADVKLDEQLPYSDIKMPDQFTQPQSAAIGASNTLDIGSSIAPKIIKYLYNKRTGLDMPEEQAKQMSDKIFNQAYEQNPVSYGAGRVAGEVGSGGLISKGAGGIIKGVQNYPKLLKVAEKYAEPALFGATSGATSAMRGGDAENIATNALIGGAATKVVPKLAEGVAALPGKIRDTAKGAVRFFTGTTKDIANFIDKNPELAKQITQKNYPSSEELIKQTIQQKKPILEQMQIFKDAETMKKEAVNHLLENDYKYDPLHVANLIDEKIKDIPISSKLSEQLKSELKSHVNFYKTAFQDENENIIPMDGQQISKLINDFQTLAKQAYKEGNAPEASKIYGNIAAQIRKEIGKDVPGFDKYMRQSEKLVNKGLFIKKKLGEPKQGINWQSADEQSLINSPISEQKLQSMIFDRRYGQVGTSAMRDRDLMRLNEIMPSGAKISPEDILRVQGKKLIENPRNVGTGSAPILTGTPFGIGVSALAHSQGMDYLPASALGSAAAIYAGQKIRQEGPALATKGYMNIKKAEDAASSLKNASTNLINKFIGTKYQKILQDAAMKGSKSFASTVFTLKSSDNDFRQQYNEIQGLDK